MTEQIEHLVNLTEKWGQAMTYHQYIERIQQLLSTNKTTGENHSEAMLHYTLMNQYRMKRLQNHTKLRDEVQQLLHTIEHPQRWLVLTEAWCGDAAQSVPVMHLMAEASDFIEFRLLLRDEHPDLMDRYLYKGRSRSIPRLIILDGETIDDLVVWGPRPAEAQTLFEEASKKPGVAYQEVAEELQKWYITDRTQAIQRELADAVREAINRSGLG